jgi:hypothetical protein
MQLIDSPSANYWILYTLTIYNRIDIILLPPQSLSQLRITSMRQLNPFHLPQLNERGGTTHLLVTLSPKRTQMSWLLGPVISTTWITLATIEDDGSRDGTYMMQKIFWDIVVKGHHYIL